MMNYEIFKEVVAEKFKDYLAEEYKDMKLEVNQIEKVNRTLDGLNLISGEEGIIASPTIYINDMYEQYKQCEDLQNVLHSAAVTMEQAFEKTPQIAQIDLESAKDHIVFQLVNTEQNRELLKGVPHRQFQDLSIIYRWVMKADETGIQSTMLQNELAEKMGFREEQLFQLAAENTRRIMPPCIRSMNEVVREMLLADGMPEAMADTILMEMSPEVSMWIIGNERGINGASSMLYEDKLHALAEQIGTDLYIMPSSVHEVIAVSSDLGDPQELAEMVSEVNMSTVSLEERLSNQVYHYDKDLRKLSLATDTPNKRLDGIVAEPSLIYETKQSR